jgi:hypothetical protein
VYRVNVYFMMQQNAPLCQNCATGVANAYVALVTAAWGNQCDVTVVYMVTIARTCT